MGRIRKAYEAKFRQLLRHLGARQLDQGMDWFARQTELAQAYHHLSEAQALEQVWRRARGRLGQWQRAENSTVVLGDAPCPPAQPPRFLCDAGLGGLARWIRAAGYEARWIPDIDDDDLVREAQEGNETILTTDSMLMERRLLRDAIVPAVFVPPTMKPFDQLTAILEELKLPLRETRCMACGGKLNPVSKEAMRERIPPRTFRWLDDYFVCEACGKLFWHGTHWQRIQRRLRG